MKNDACMHLPKATDASSGGLQIPPLLSIPWLGCGHLHAVAYRACTPCAWLVLCCRWRGEEKKEEIKRHHSLTNSPKSARGSQAGAQPSCASMANAQHASSSNLQTAKMDRCRLSPLLKALLSETCTAISRAYMLQRRPADVESAVALAVHFCHHESWSGLSSSSLSHSTTLVVALRRGKAKGGAARGKTPLCCMVTFTAARTIHA